MKVQIKGNELQISMPINSDPQPSKSGKTLVVATTNGFTVTNAQVNGKSVSLSINAVIPNK